jgi:lysozyme
VDFGKIIDPVILKATESTDYIDPTFKERKDILRKKGLYLGSYHFFRDVDPVLQARFYALNNDWKERELCILDFEINCSRPLEKCQEFLKHLKNPMLYTNEARNIKYGLKAGWVAKYGTNSGKMQTPPKGDWKIWQFSSKGKADGITGNVDLNFTPLSKEELVNNQNEVNIDPPIVAQGIQKYSQNDPLWKDDFMGNSHWKLGPKGCTVDAICTIGSYFGETITPKEMATHKELFTVNSNPQLDGLIIWNKLDAIFKYLKFGSRVRFFNETMIDLALKNPDTCVILNVDHNYHWVACLRKTNLGYTCADSWPYPAVNRNYKNAEIGGFSIFTKK